MPYLLAIDLHPSATTVAVQWDGQPPSLLSLDGDRPVIESIVAVASSGETLFGSRAATLASHDPHRVSDDFVQRIGDPRPIELGGRPLAAPDVTGLFLGVLYRAVAQMTRREPDAVAICYPAFYDAYRIGLLDDAARRGGLPPVRLISQAAATSAYATSAHPTAHAASPGPTTAAFGALAVLAGRASAPPPPPFSPVFARPPDRLSQDAPATAAAPAIAPSTMPATMPPVGWFPPAPSQYEPGLGHPHDPWSSGPTGPRLLAPGSPPPFPAPPPAGSAPVAGGVAPAAIGRRRRPIVVAVAAALVVAALVIVVVRSGGDGPSATASTTTPANVPSPATRPGSTGPGRGSTAPGNTGSDSTAANPAPGRPTTPATAPPDAAMTETLELDPLAVWQDGSPISAADFDCTWRAFLNTPTTVSKEGYDSITAVTQGKDAHEVVISYSTPFAAYRTLFSALIQRSAVDDCDDVSGDFQTTLASSGREWKLQSWSDSQEILVPNSRYWGPKPTTSKIVIKPIADDVHAAVTSGDVDYSYELFGEGIAFQPGNGQVSVATGSTSQFEALYFNEKDGRPFADPAVREAFYESIDLDALFAQIYAPIAPGGTLLACGPVPRGPLCQPGLFGNRFDLAKAQATMTAAGYAKNGDGLWSKDGVVLEVKWMVTSGNRRRESAQSYLIPLLAAAGFDVTADNCDSSCVFQDRLPSLDYDLTMYTNTTTPDPGYLVPQFTSDNIPIDANSGLGLNDQAWTNAAATKALHDSEGQLDPAKRTDDIKAAIREMDKDSVLIPLYQFPSLASHRIDRVDAVDGEIDNIYRAFSDVARWKDVDGDGTITIGVPDWPSCLNPVSTDCGGSFVYLWAVSNLVLPGVFDPTPTGYAVTSLVTAEPVITTP